MITILKQLFISAFSIFRHSLKENTNKHSSQSNKSSLSDNQTDGGNEAADVPKCPHCGKVQGAWPERSKKKCSYCKRTMHVRHECIEKERGTGNLILSDKILVTEDDAWVYDWILDLFDFGYSKKKFDRKRSEFAKKQGVAISNREAVWSILNELLEKYTKSSDLSKMQTVEFFMAKFLKEKEEDPYIQLREQGKTRLVQLKSDSCNQVKICLSKRKSDPLPCDICLALENRVYSIDRALDELPLPPKECKNKYCYTYYGQIFEPTSMALE